MKRILSLLVAMVMALGCVGITAMAEETAVEVATYDGLAAALAQGGNIILTADITTTAALTTSGVTATIDLNGKTLNVRAGDNKFNDKSNITIKNGTINIDGVTVDGNAIFCLDEYEETLVTTLTLDNVNLEGKDYSSAYGIFYIGKSSVLNVSGGNWVLSNEQARYADGTTSGGVFKADSGSASLNITGVTMELYNVQKVITHATTTIANSNISITGDAEVSDKMEHGINRSALTVTNSTITMENLVGRGITAENGAVTISNGSTVTITNAQEATIKVNSNQTVTIFEDSTVSVDAEPTITSGSISGTVVTVSAVAKIGDVEYTSFDKAITAANTMTGNVTVEIYGKVEYTDSTANLTGSYDSISFVGKTDDAEISLTRNGTAGYIGRNSTNADISFTDLILSKPAGGYAGDADHMNAAFTVYIAKSVTYTNCTFPNGACASGCETTYEKCTFQKSHAKYALWTYGYNTVVAVNECNFDAARGIKLWSYATGDERTALTVTNCDFSKLTEKPAIVLSNGKSITLAENTYPDTGVLELDNDPTNTQFSEGAVVTSDNDSAISCVDYNKNACGVLVDGKIYTTVAEAAAVATTGSTVTLLHNSTETVELAEGVTLDKNGYTADGVTVKAPEPSGTLSTCYFNERNEGESHITGAINGLYATESVVIKTYSGKNQIAETTLQKPEYFEWGDKELTVKICIGDTSGSWNTVWEAGHPNELVQPDKAELYVDGQLMNTVAVNSYANDYYEGYPGQSWVWSKLTGVKKAVLPNAEVNSLGAITVTDNNGDGDYSFGTSYYVYDLANQKLNGTSSEAFDLNVAMKFTANDTEEEAKANAYANYTTDFFIKIDGLSSNSFVGDDCYLAGYYPSYNAWVKIPLDGLTIENGKTYPVISLVGWDFKYVDICTDVKEFTCGIYLSEKVITENPGINVNLALGLAENLEAAQGASFTTVGAYTYDAEDFKEEEVDETAIFGTPFYMIDLPMVDGQYQVNLYSGIDSLKYKEVGFKVYDKNENLLGQSSTNTVYTSIKGSNMTIVASEFNMFRIFGVEVFFGTAWDNTEIYFRPYAKDLNDKEILGKKYPITDIYTK